MTASDLSGQICSLVCDFRLRDALRSNGWYLDPFRVDAVLPEELFRPLCDLRLSEITEDIDGLVVIGPGFFQAPTEPKYASPARRRRASSRVQSDCRNCRRISWCMAVIKARDWFR